MEKVTVMVSKKKASSQKSTKKTTGNDPSSGKGLKCSKCRNFRHLELDCRTGFICIKCNGNEDTHPEIALLVAQADRTIKD